MWSWPDEYRVQSAVRLAGVVADGAGVVVVLLVLLLCQALESAARSEARQPNMLELAVQVCYCEEIASTSACACMSCMSSDTDRAVTLNRLTETVCLSARTVGFPQIRGQSMRSAAARGWKHGTGHQWLLHAATPTSTVCNRRCQYMLQFRQGKPPATNAGPSGNHSLDCTIMQSITMCVLHCTVLFRDVPH